MPDEEQSFQTRRLLARKVRLLRQARGWSQEALAGLCGLHRTYIGAVERSERNISLDNVERIAAVFEMTVGELLNEKSGEDFLRFLGVWRVDEPAPVYITTFSVPVHTLRAPANNFSSQRREARKENKLVVDWEKPSRSLRLCG